MNHIGGKGEGGVGKDKADNADGLNPFHVASCKPGRHNRRQEDSKALENGIGQGTVASHSANRMISAVPASKSNEISPHSPSLSTW